MKIAQINATCGKGSTGNICTAVSDLLTANGVEDRIFYCLGSTDHPAGIKYSFSHEIKAAALQARLTGNWGREGGSASRRLLRALDGFAPDALLLHNLHSHACALPALFAWVHTRKIKVYWTFHDCWAFTGLCMHYDEIGCERWRDRCGSCPQRGAFSLFRDRSESLLAMKRELLLDTDLTVIAPSAWMKRQVEQSFLRDRPCYVIRNGIDLTAFCPTPGDIRTRIGCENRKLVLGVSAFWDKSKGLDVFLALAKRLPENYRIVLLGTDAELEKRLPPNILPLRKTSDQHTLAELYTAADVFVNPTRADTYPTVNMEALACGTPVVTFRTGGSAEIPDESCGIAVEKDNISGLTDQIIRVCETGFFSREACLRRAERFDRNACFRDYAALLLSDQAENRKYNHP